MNKERGARRPQGPALVLLNLIDRDPSAVVDSEVGVAVVGVQPPSSLYSCVIVCIIKGVNCAALIRKIKADGWVLVHTVGSHHQFKHPTKPGKVTVPHPKKDLPLPTVRSILRQAGL